MGPDHFLEGGGELGALMRAYDWSTTPLGCPATWPRSLKTAVRIMLTSRQPFWLGWGPELTYLYNDPYKSIIGGKHPAALGRPFKEVWSELWDVIGPMADTVMNRDEGTYVEQQLLIMERHGYQEETYYTFSYSPIPGDDGRPGGLICANTDDTRRVIGERQLSLLSELSGRTASARSWQEACALSMDAFSSNPRDLPFALIFMSDDQRGPVQIRACSKGAEDLVRPELWPCEDVMLTGQLDVVPIDPKCGWLPAGAWPRPPKAAAVLPITVSGMPGHAGVLVVGLNPFRTFDENYRDFLWLVTQQVGAAIANARAYEAEKQRAESLAELDRAKTTFFSNISHEFRTPLTLILGPLDDLLEDPDGMAPQHRATLTTLQRNGQRLLKLVNTLLDFARIESGRTQAAFEATDLSRLTIDLASNFQSAMDRAGLSLTVDAPSLSAPAYLDREMWEKVVLNLVSNAFKFTFEGGIHVAVKESDHHFIVSVTDTGTGIAPADLPYIFDRFRRVEGARGRSHEGSGIGLSLVQELVRLHGGALAVESELGTGTAVRVSIPKGSAHLPSDQVRPGPAHTRTGIRADAYVNEALGWLPDREAPLEPPGLRDRRVLVADDNADLREYARRLLADDYAVQVVSNGVEALAAARAQRPDVIVSDVMMPELDGFGLIRELRGDPSLRDVPVILLSARAGEESRLEGLSRGADDYLVKPFSSRELLVRVGTLINSAEIHRRVRQALAQFETLLNEAPMGVFLVDDRGKIVAINPVAVPAFGDEQDLIGRDLLELKRRIWPAPRVDEIMRVFRHTLETGEPYYVPEWVEERLDRKVTEYYEWQINRIPLPNGRFGVVAYFRDISKFVLAREALRDADRRKDEFLATLSHELRNPLAPLRNTLQLMRLTGPRDTASGHRLEIMERQVLHLIRLVDDLLEVSRISRGAFELRRERVDVASIVRNAIETSDPLLRSGGHRLSVTLPEQPLWLEGDPVRLAQVLANLLNNAATYTPTGGELSVSVRSTDTAAVISVRDNGKGIAGKDLSGIFEMFNRGGSRIGGPGGLGIGLALARRLTEMHGGTIEAKSEGPDRGSEFVVTLPLALTQESEDSPDTVDSDMRRTKILVVDDNHDAADSLGQILECLGADVRVTHDGAAALAAFSSYDPSVVLLDIGMPGMDGYEVARRMRAGFPDRRTAIVALTGWGQEEDRRRAREAGFDHHLIKPAEIGELQALLKDI